MKLNIKYIIEFFNDDTIYFAASLSFFTIFSFLPILALIIVIMSTTPYFSSQIDLFMIYLYDFINPTHSEQIIFAIQGALENINKLGDIGIIYLLFIFTMFFKDYEYIISKIHNTKKRAFIPMILLYISFLIIIPFSFIVIAFIISYIQNNILLSIANIIFAITLITILFKLSINKYISLKASLFVSSITVLALKITQVLFIYYIAYNTTYSTIYGTLSAMLFVFLWIYVSWIIYLYGIKLIHRLNTRLENEH
jgi:membrane protein